MKKLVFALLIHATLALFGCAEVESSLERTAAAKSAPSGQRLTTVNGLGSVVIKEGSATLAVCRTASPNVEQTRFINQQNQLVVKSRGNHGPATVELFDTRSGRLEGTVKADEIANGGLAWAAGMAD